MQNEPKYCFAEHVRADYVEKPNDEQLIEDAINGMLTALDPHSSYLNPRGKADRPPIRSAEPRCGKYLDKYGFGRIGKIHDSSRYSMAVGHCGFADPGCITIQKITGS